MAAALIGKLGSLVLGTDGVVDVGPLPASFGFEGPFNSVSDYFLSWSRNSTFGKPDFLLTHHDDNDWLRKLKQDVASFPSRLKTIIEKGSLKNLSSRNRYPILNRDFLPRNMLFDDEFNIVGVIDWEGAHSAPIEVFAALTNMYSRFDPETLHMVPDSDDGRRYIEDVKDKDRETGQALSERRLEACSAISVPI
jgi:aminoglycoside phosphotransferase (APT) family kinase protein